MTGSLFLPPLCTPPIWSLGHPFQLNVCCLDEPTGKRGGHRSSQYGPAVAPPLGSKRARNQESRAALSPSPCCELCLCYPNKTWLSVGSPKGRPEPSHGVKEVVFGVHPRNLIDPSWACTDRRTEGEASRMTDHHGPQRLCSGAPGRSWCDTVDLYYRPTDKQEWPLLLGSQAG